MHDASHTKFVVIRSVCNQSGRVPDCVCNSILISPCWTVKCRLQQMSHVSPGVLSVPLSLSVFLALHMGIAFIIVHPPSPSSSSQKKNTFPFPLPLPFPLLSYRHRRHHHRTGPSRNSGLRTGVCKCDNLILGMSHKHTNISPRTHTYIHSEPQCRSARKVIKTRDK